MNNAENLYQAILSLINSSGLSVDLVYYMMLSLVNDLKAATYQIALNQLKNPPPEPTDVAATIPVNVTDGPEGWTDLADIVPQTKEN